MALYSLYCADVPLRNCSLTHSVELILLAQCCNLSSFNKWSLYQTIRLYISFWQLVDDDNVFAY